MEPHPTEADEKNLAFLRRLVTVLTAVMIFGVVLIVILLALRLTAPPAPLFPDDVQLPEGAVPVSVTRGPDFLLVVTEDRRILVFDPTGQDMRQTFTLQAPE